MRDLPFVLAWLGVLSAAAVVGSLAIYGAAVLAHGCP